MTELREVLIVAAGVLLAAGVMAFAGAAVTALGSAKRQDWRGEGNTEGQR